MLPPHALLARFLPHMASPLRRMSSHIPHEGRRISTGGVRDCVIASKRSSLPREGGAARFFTTCKIGFGRSNGERYFHGPQNACIFALASHSGLKSAGFSTISNEGIMYTKLPPGWIRYEDDETGLPYYHNTETGETVWERPIPSASIPSKQDRAATNGNIHRGRKSAQNISNVCLYVGNLPKNYKAEDLQREFSKFGRLRDHFVSFKDGKFRGFGFVEFERSSDAKRAVDAMDGVNLSDRAIFENRRPMKVTFAKERKSNKMLHVPSHKQLESELERLLGGYGSTGLKRLSDLPTTSDCESALRAYRGFRRKYYRLASGWKVSDAADRLICPTAKSFGLLLQIPSLHLKQLRKLSLEISRARVDPHVDGQVYRKLVEEIARRGSIREAWEISAACVASLNDKDNVPFARHSGPTKSGSQGKIEMFRAAAASFEEYRISEEQFKEAMTYFHSCKEKTRDLYAMAMRLLVARATHLKGTNYEEARNSVVRAYDLYGELRILAESSQNCTSSTKIQQENAIQAKGRHNAANRFSTNTTVRIVVESLLNALLDLGEYDTAMKLVTDRVAEDPGWCMPSDDDQFDPKGGSLQRHQGLLMTFIRKINASTSRNRKYAIEVFSRLSHKFNDSIWRPARRDEQTERLSRAEARILRICRRMMNIFLMESDPWLARTLFEDMNAKGMCVSSPIYAAMIWATIMESSVIDVQRAEQLFDQAIERSKQRYARAIKKTRRIASYGSGNIVQKTPEYNLEINVHDDALQQLLCVDPDIEKVFVSMINVYVSAGHIEEAVCLFDALRDFLHHLGKVPGSFTYEKIIHGLCQYKQFEEAKEFWEDLTHNARMPPNKRLYSYMTRVYVDSGDIDSALLLSGEMSARGMQPSIQNSTLLVDALGQTGNHAEANQLFLDTERRLRRKQQKLKELSDSSAVLEKEKHLSVMRSDLYVAIAKSCLRIGRNTEARQRFIDGLFGTGTGTSGEEVLVFGMIEGLLCEVIRRMVSKPPPKVRLRGDAYIPGFGGAGIGETTKLLDLATELFEDSRRSGALNRKHHVSLSVDRKSQKREQRNKLYNLMLQAHGSVGNIRKAQSIMKDMEFYGQDIVEGMHGLLDIYLRMGRAEEALELACDPRLEYGILGRVRVMISTGRIEDALALASDNKSLLLRELGVVRSTDSYGDDCKAVHPKRVEQWQPANADDPADNSGVVRDRQGLDSANFPLSQKASTDRYERRLEDVLVNLLQQHSWKVVEMLMQTLGLDATPKSKRSLLAKLTNLLSNSTERCKPEELLEAIQHVENEGYSLTFRKGHRAPQGDTAIIRCHIAEWFISEAFDAHERGIFSDRDKFRSKAREFYVTLRRRGAFLHPDELGTVNHTASTDQYATYRCERPRWLRRAMRRVMSLKDYESPIEEDDNDEEEEYYKSVSSVDENGHDEYGEGDMSYNYLSDWEETEKRAPSWADDTFSSEDCPSSWSDDDSSCVGYDNDNGGGADNEDNDEASNDDYKIIDFNSDYQESENDVLRGKYSPSLNLAVLKKGASSDRNDTVDDSEGEEHWW